MTPSSAPPAARPLKALDAILAKAGPQWEARKIAPAVLLSLRLFPDMLPFTRQIMIATDNAKGAASRLAGAEVPSFPDTETTFAELRARVAKTIAHVESFTEADYEGAADRTITLTLRSGELTMPGAVYLASWAIPNFYFHMTTAYDLLRHSGVELGKTDYLGTP